MKSGVMRAGAWGLVVVLGLLAAGCATGRPVLRDRRVAVMEFENTAGVEKGKAVAEWMTASLANYPRVAVVESAAVRSHMRSGEAGKGNLLQEAGRKAGVDYLLLGSVSKVDRNFIINARLLSVSTGEIVKGTSVTRASNREEDLFPLTQAIARVLAGQVKYLAEQYDQLAAAQ